MKEKGIRNQKQIDVYIKKTNQGKTRKQGKRKHSKKKNTSVNNILRNRKIQYFLDKMKSKEEQKDSIAKVTVQMIRIKVAAMEKHVLPYIFSGILFLSVNVLIVAFPLIAFMGVFYSSPFGVFFPVPEGEDGVPDKVHEYLDNFNMEVDNYVNNHEGYDQGRVEYLGTDYHAAVKDNYHDIIAVYMVKYGMGENAAVIDSDSVERIRQVADDMCGYETVTGSERIWHTDDNGNSDFYRSSYICVRVKLKTYVDMEEEYEFGEEERELLQELMESEELRQM